jgi:hypothetical protein
VAYDETAKERKTQLQAAVLDSTGDKDKAWRENIN